MFGLGMLGTILIWAGIGAAVLLAKVSYDHAQQAKGAAEREQELLPKIQVAERDRDAAKAGRDAAEAANRSLQLDLVELDKQRMACSREVGKLVRQEQRIKDLQAARKPIDDKKVEEISIERSELIAALGLPDKSGTCEQQLARRNAMLKRLTEQQLRDFPPTNPGAAPTPPAKDDGAVIIKVPK